MPLPHVVSVVVLQCCTLLAPCCAVCVVRAASSGRAATATDLTGSSRADSDAPLVLTSIAAGDSHLLLNDDRGRVWAVGHNSRGQTGLPYRPRYSRPQRLLDVEA